VRRAKKKDAFWMGEQFSKGEATRVVFISLGQVLTFI
jgi:hypothetical protein